MLLSTMKEGCAASPSLVTIASAEVTELIPDGVMGEVAMAVGVEVQREENSS